MTSRGVAVTACVAVTLRVSRRVQAPACINCGLTSIVSGFCDFAQNDAAERPQ